MKKLLLSAILLGSFSLFAQEDCSTPIELTDSGLNTAPELTGTHEAACFNITETDAGGTLYGQWYSFTAPSSGEVTVSSNLPQNVAPNSNDTMVSIMTGTCGSLECVASNDDVSATNYLSSVSFPVAAGVTYYIQWSNYWNSNGFDFDFTFTPIDCLPVYDINALTNIGTQSVTLNWDASLSGPAGYDIEYGPVGFTQGTGTTVTSTTNSKTLSGLDASTAYDFYIRSDCGTSQSTWTEANTFSTAKLCPYASGLDSAAQLAGWTVFGAANQGLGNNATVAQTPAGYWIMNTAAAPGPNNNWLFTPAFSFQQNEQVTVSFYHRATTTVRTLRVTVGTAATAAAQTTVLAALSIPVGATWTQVTVPAYSVPAAGLYYFGFNDNSIATPTTASSMRLDSFNFTSVLASSDFLSSKFAIYPNPVNNVVNFSNDVNAIVDTVEMTDMNGRIIKSAKVNATEGQISVGDLATGVYMMKITTDQGVATKKIVKQ